VWETALKSLESVYFKIGFCSESKIIQRIMLEKRVKEEISDCFKIFYGKDSYTVRWAKE
jgi:hypothetical protein